MSTPINAAGVPPRKTIARTSARKLPEIFTFEVVEIAVRSLKTEKPSRIANSGRFQSACGACQTASNLTLKFIVHFGYIKEIKVAQFVKATGIDMIVAHRLLKNDVGAHEYILITEPCCAAVGQDDANPKFQWAKSSQVYDTIGNVAYEFATLTGYKAQISPPSAPPRFVVEKGDDNLEVVINAPSRRSIKH